ncbi:hypothetical protein ACFCXA_24135 [Streptomyces virginiae]|uniref:hypothetical protein n=1 Tax=Streptomyces virginiae TaxID=1961 RepID=UPI003246AE83
MGAGATALLVHNCPTVSSKDIKGLLNRAETLHDAWKPKSTVAVARVWNRETEKIEHWVATNVDDLPVEIKRNLNGAECKFGPGDAEATIVGKLVDGKHNLLGIASQWRTMVNRNFWDGT